jgi:hypothetical protein
MGIVGAHLVGTLGGNQLTSTSRHEGTKNLQIQGQGKKRSSLPA